MGANNCEGPIVYIHLYMNYICIWYKLTIRANSCECDYVHVTYTIIVADTSSCLLSSQLLAPINNATYVYIAQIPMYIYIYIYCNTLSSAYGRPSVPCCNTVSSSYGRPSVQNYENIFSK